MQYRHRLALAASLLIFWTHEHDSVFPGALAFSLAKSCERRPWSSSTMTYTKQHLALISSKSPFPLQTRQTHWPDRAKSPLLATPSFEDTDETNHGSEEKSLLIQEENWETASKTLELIALGAWLATISAFTLVNNFVGPWPEAMTHVPDRVFFLCHMIGGMLFGGGVLLTAAIEWLVVDSKSDTVQHFGFDKVPLLDGLIVLPALAVSMISGTGLTIRRYGGLGHAPEHIQAVF